MERDVAVAAGTAILMLASLALSMIMFPNVWGAARRSSWITNLKMLPAYVWVFQAFAFFVTFAGSAAVLGMIFGDGGSVTRAVGAGVLLVGWALLKESKKAEVREKARRGID